MPTYPQTPILIVEDDPGTAALEKRHLERAGYASDTAATADEALARLRGRRYALLILDYRLPGAAEGLSFYQRLREEGYDLPVVLIWRPAVRPRGTVRRSRHN
jgi:DNA-binding response OmpR family regulator